MCAKNEFKTFLTTHLTNQGLWIIRSVIVTLLQGVRPHYKQVNSSLFFGVSYNPGVSKCFTKSSNLLSKQASTSVKEKLFVLFLGMYLFFIQEGLRMKWSHTACTHISVRHRHALKKHIYTCIFGIACSLVAGLMGCQKHSSSHLTS